VYFQEAAVITVELVDAGFGSGHKEKTPGDASGRFSCSAAYAIKRHVPSANPGECRVAKFVVLRPRPLRRGDLGLRCLFHLGEHRVAKLVMPRPRFLNRRDLRLRCPFHFGK
jgi:hypothetical protein